CGKRWNALFISKKIVWICHAFHPCQSLEVTLEVLFAPFTCLCIACAALAVGSQVQIPGSIIMKTISSAKNIFHIPSSPSSGPLGAALAGILQNRGWIQPNSFECSPQPAIQAQGSFHS
ncbi:hypothetical protein QQP08_019037, partial [Theobroma cacao]